MIRSVWGRIQWMVWLGLWSASGFAAEANSETGASPLTRVREAFAAVRESDWVAHACELETSVYLALEPDHVDMSRAERDVSFEKSPHFWSDLAGAPPAGYRNAVALTEYWSTVTRDGVKGDPTVATAAKGTELLRAAADELVDIVREFKARPVKPHIVHQSVRAPGTVA